MTSDPPTGSQWREVSAGMAAFAAMTHRVAWFELMALLSAQAARRARSPHHCHCLCAMHPQWPGVCTTDYEVTVTLTGGFITGDDVPMCRSCGRGWQADQPHRVAEVRDRKPGP